MRRTGPITAALAASLLATVASAQTFEPGGPDAAAYGQAQGYPTGTWDNWYEKPHMVWGFSHYDSLVKTHTLPAAAKPWTFKRAAAEPELHYVPDILHLKDGPVLSLADYMARVPATGLLILKDDTILVERYQYGRTDKDRFTSQSMAKTLVSLLLGAAIADGRVKDIGDPAEAYVPTLKGSAYGQTPLKALLQMSSGVAFEDAEPRGLYQDIHSGVDEGTALAKYARATPAGSHFQYSCGDSETLTTVVRHATGQSLSDYLTAKVWQPMGAEAEARWEVDASGQEIGCSGFNATLRDYGRLGRLLAHDGAWEGKQLIPKDWLLAATTQDPADTQVASGTAAHLYGYGYQVWVLPPKVSPDGRRLFALLGAEGQYIFVDPKTKLVMVQTSVKTDNLPLTSPHSETLALWLAVIREWDK
ncbi:serine hydrolase [Nitrospirillum sp. BR 11163]|uniref:serine hydrolase domain-containing protein n=1 Tax=Nitrospirillum sp. BR 11163 TaxID=3104323 RepID=UPI002AFF7B21|nr:serine hydrolase [Nitrospirillum sp. BR 11163]MEA1677706.1 serine hydrolase [Nitrospirillum sp. BR 11163]